MPLVLNASMGIRVVAVLATVVASIFLPLSAALIIFIILGLAHFLLAFWYQREAGKLDAKKTVLYAALLAGAVWMGTQLGFDVFLFIIALSFGFHLIRDELYLMKGELSVFTTLEALPFLVLYAGLLSDGTFGTAFFVPSVSIAAAILLAYAILAVRMKRRPDRVSYVHFFWILVAAGAYGVELATGSFIPVLWFLGLTVMHYIIWYLEYWNKLAVRPEKRGTYVRRVLIANVLFGVLAYVFFQGYVPVLAVFFGPLYFYAWAFVHILTSLRPGDYAHAFRIVR